MLLHGSSKWNVVYHFVYRKARVVLNFCVFTRKFQVKKMWLWMSGYASVAECQFSIPIRVSDVGSINWSYEEGVEVFFRVKMK